VPATTVPSVWVTTARGAVRSLSQDQLTKIVPWFGEVPEDISKASQACTLRILGESARGRWTDRRMITTLLRIPHKRTSRVKVKIAKQVSTRTSPLRRESVSSTLTLPFTQPDCRAGKRVGAPLSRRVKMKPGLRVRVGFDPRRGVPG